MSKVSKPHSTLTAHELAETFLRTPLTLHSNENIRLVAQSLLDLEEQLESAHRDRDGWIETAAKLTTNLSGADEQLEALQDELTRIAVDPARAFSLIERGVVSSPASEPHVHEWVDARNAVIESGEICLGCMSMRAAHNQDREPS